MWGNDWIPQIRFSVCIGRGLTRQTLWETVWFEAGKRKTRAPVDGIIVKRKWPLASEISIGLAILVWFFIKGQNCCHTWDSSWLWAGIVTLMAISIIWVFAETSKTRQKRIGAYTWYEFLFLIPITSAFCGIMLAFVIAIPILFGLYFVFPWD